MLQSSDEKLSLNLAFWVFACLVFLPGCWLAQDSAAPKDLQIKITPVFADECLVLGNRLYVSDAGDSLYIDRFRFYLSSLELVFKDGSVFREKESYHLIDAEEEKSCLLTVKRVPTGRLASIRFNVGVDSLKSVSGALDGDLDPAKGMYWAWNSGYINAKLEGRCKSGTAWQRVFEFHIGGYAYPENALRTVELATGHAEDDFFKDRELVICADTKAWLTGILLANTSGVMVPGKQAMQIADNYKVMFKLAHLK